MRQRSFIALALALAILVVGAVGVYAYDKSNDNTIAKGVTAGGVDLSGMSPAKARDTLQRELADPTSGVDAAFSSLPPDGGFGRPANPTCASSCRPRSQWAS